MPPFNKLIAVLSVAGCAISGAAADDHQSKLDEALERYDRTGETTRCLTERRIRSTKVIDDNAILFVVNSKTAYLNELPRRCIGLGFNQSIAYGVRGTSICRGDRFRVVDTSPVQTPTCRFGDFEKLVVKSDKEESDKSDGPDQ